MKLGQLLVVGLVLLVAGGITTSCTGASDSNPSVKTSGASNSGPNTTAAPRSASVATTSGAQRASACRFITPAVLRLAAFPVHVAVVPATGKAQPGLSVCTYGDAPDPKLLSLNSVILIEATPTYLRARKVTAQGLATVDLDCVHGSIRTVGPGNGLGTFATWCVGKPGSVRGNWIQNGAVYSLSYSSPSDASRAIGARLDRYRTIARAIAKNIGN